MSENRDEVIALLKQAYSMELETVTNYLANSINLDGVRAEEIKKALAADVTEEIGHAQVLGLHLPQLLACRCPNDGISISYSYAVPPPCRVAASFAPRQHREIEAATTDAALKTTA